ncbi:MAG TPA: hypothetical protein VIV40_28165 [Kofleriaceae bacterium]
MRRGPYPATVALLSLLWLRAASAQPETTAQPDAAAAVEAAPSKEPPAPSPRRLALEPFLVLVGGLNYDRIGHRDSTSGMVADERESRATTLALTRFGVEGVALPHVRVRSELELNAGPHGASVWEGQAAITVRDQFIGLLYGDARLYVGRISDPASIDYFSAHVANLLLTDFQIRIPFLASGANRGDGVALRYQLMPELSAGMTVNAGNPVSSTSTAALGGTYPPFSRFYYNIIATVRESATRFPSDLFHAMVFSPSLQWESGWLRAQLAYQYLVVDVTTADEDNPLLHGHNVRGGVQALVAGGTIRPFINGSFVTNEVIGSNGSLPDISMISPDRFRGFTASTGVDVAISGRSGVGGQYNAVVEQQGDGSVFTSHFVNVGASWWFHDEVALQARYSAYLRCEDESTGRCGSRLENQHNFYLTFLGTFGGVPARGAGLF